MLTLALYNSYDPKKIHEAHLRAIARAAPVCYAFDFHLALIGFPFDEPLELVERVSGSTTIGEGGKYLLELAKRRYFPPSPIVVLPDTLSTSSSG